MELHWPEYAAAFLGALAVAWVVTPLVLKIAIRRQVLDVPDERKAQTSPVPYLGGLAIVAGFSAMVFAAAAMDRASSVLIDLGILLGTGLVLALMGLLDDLRGGISPYFRLVVEIGAGVVVYETSSGALLGGPHWVDLVVTVVWVVGITNAFNLLDNMDGLSAGVAAIAAAAFGLLAALHGQYLVAALAAGTAGCASGFLRHNFHPARIYMGDAGSLFLGYLLAVLGLKITLLGTPAVVAAFVPLLVLGVPVFDTTLVTWQRLRHGRSPMQGGRDHASHRLVWVGIPVPVAVCLLYAAGICLAWLAVLLARLDTVSGLVLVAFVLTVGTFLLGLLAAVPVYDNSRQRRSMLRVVREHDPEQQAG
ncbi:MAG: undecaprenyl/decaprenyl-phosphate alpha-N-acetylglucosaminyl 1-phosphate transferase [Actinobacteria bacterium]|nr:undecaprenyl/decaprenyl-phosphate alpha-N-acetylglucosaminyl 1-phosphate transferase [Actinomycetota bacterium]MCA1721592.1 undecaprenyl/decaprenyl-phosphate alpha-N-acetylglucosaminyl 1-phosphate transferase [Actinomycetota bacterium]